MLTSYPDAIARLKRDLLAQPVIDAMRYKQLLAIAAKALTHPDATVDLDAMLEAEYQRRKANPDIREKGFSNKSPKVQ